MKYQKEKKFYLFILSCLFAIGAFFIRTAGISLIAAYPLYLFLNKKYRHLFFFIILFLVFFIPWQIRNEQISTSGGYLDQLLAKNPYQMELGRIGFMEMLHRILENFVFYAFTIVPTTILPLLKSEVMLALAGIALLVFVIAGAFNRIRVFTLIDIYFIMSIIVLFIWPKVWSSERFFLPIIPVYIIYLYSGILRLQKKFKSRYLAVMVIGLLIFLNIFAFIPQIRTSIKINLSYLKGYRYAGYTIDWQRYFEMIEWVDKNIPDNKIIMARKPEFVYLLSGHKSFCYPFTTDNEKVKSAIEKADYIIFDNFQWTGTTHRYLLPVLQKMPEKFKVIHKTKTPEFFLLEVLK